MIKAKTVAQLHRGQSGIIEGLTDDILSLKLLEMGCIPGSRITFDFQAPLGDPICVRVSGYQLSLRKSEAATITLE